MIKVLRERSIDVKHNESVSLAVRLSNRFRLGGMKLEGVSKMALTPGLFLDMTLPSNSVG